MLFLHMLYATYFYEVVGYGIKLNTPLWLWFCIAQNTLWHKLKSRSVCPQAEPNISTALKTSNMPFFKDSVLTVLLFVIDVEKSLIRIEQ